MQCFRRCALALFAIIALGLAAAAGVAAVLAPLLSADDPPVASSAIAVLGGDPTRAITAADLYLEGLAPRVLVAAPPPDPVQKRLDALGIVTPRHEELMRRVLLARGVPGSAIAPFKRSVNSTAEEARVLRDMIAPGETLLVVTSPYHVLRARLILATELPRERFRVIASRAEPFPVKWWRDRDAATPVVLEIAKLAFFLVGGHF
jgi:uncharacterized SAM-binding protein YcdF (DUF218 family)